MRVLVQPVLKSIYRRCRHHYIRQAVPGLNNPLTKKVQSYAQGRASKKSRGTQVSREEENFKKVPHSFVFNRGRVGKNVGDLVRDMRKVMEPFTSTRLKAKKKNVLKDFVSVAGLLNVSHFLTFSKTEIAVNLRIMRLPRGPTLTFRVNSYSLSRDIISSLKKPNMEPKQFLNHPLLVMNNLSGEGMHLKLMATMFQNMFPSINVTKVRLNNIRRCVLLNYNSETKELEFRHYNIRAVPVGMSRGMKKLIKARVPNMGKYNDVSDYLLKDGNLSESEAELDGPHNEVILPQQLASRGNMRSAKSAIRLTEIGPRMTLQLVKIEEGICDGTVIFHEFINKTEEEIRALEKRREKKRRLKLQRKKKQEENIKQKQAEKEELKRKSLAGMKKKIGNDDDGQADAYSSEDEAYASDDGTNDDVKYYKAEVGEDPDPELFPTTSKRKGVKRKSKNPRTESAKRKKEEDKPDKKERIKEFEKLRKKKIKKKQTRVSRRKKPVRGKKRK